MGRRQDGGQRRKTLSGEKNESRKRGNEECLWQKAVAEGRHNGDTTEKGQGHGKPSARFLSSSVFSFFLSFLREILSGTSSELLRAEKEPHVFCKKSCSKNLDHLCVTGKRSPGSLGCPPCPNSLHIPPLVTF